MHSVKPIDNINSLLIDDLKETLKQDSTINIVADRFSIYAYQALKKELSKINKFNFIFTKEVFTKEKTPKEAREFYIPRKNTERSLYGTNFEVKLRNELNQQSIAKECADWLKSKAQFKANIANQAIFPFALITQQESAPNALLEAPLKTESETSYFPPESTQKTPPQSSSQNTPTEKPQNSSVQALSSDSIVYNPISSFTTAELGLDKGNNRYSSTMRLTDKDATEHFATTFRSLWNNHQDFADVTDTVLEHITAAYKENSPELIYYLTLYSIFNEALQESNTDNLPDDATGFKNSEVWKRLYKFQKDAVTLCIKSLEKHNGCILADSVGLGKTFSALGIIKYYESRNRTVLVLCPKRLSDNWLTFKSNYKNNILAKDQFRYDVLFHTDLSREKGESNGLDLSKLNWSNYDLVVIDESHNFRNGDRTSKAHDDDSQNRYQKLMNKVIKEGVKTKVLMLSATPVNTSFKDLRNQLMLAAEGDSDKLTGTLDTENPIDKIFCDAENAFNKWSTLPIDQRTTDRLQQMLSFDFAHLLESLTIARSRSHIEKYYQDQDLGSFPTRLSPISLRPDLTDSSDLTFNDIFEYINDLNLAVYRPLEYVLKSKLNLYVDLDSSYGSSWANREKGKNVLMITNLLKRAESSIYSFRLTTERTLAKINQTLEKIAQHELKSYSNINFKTSIIDDLDDDGSNLSDDISVGKDTLIKIGDMDYLAWKNLLLEDQLILTKLLQAIKPITADHDTKLQELKTKIETKIQNPINPDNKKVLIFTAFADTANYLYDELSDFFKKEYNLNTAVVTGGSNPRTTLNSTSSLDFNEILTCFSPQSKDRHLLYETPPGDIDILIATDCISEGQNLQDCDYLINFDIHWNPVRIIQRFGRIDRIGSSNNLIQLVNFWPNITLDSYINLKDRVENRMKLANLSGTGADNPLDEFDNSELSYRKKQFQQIEEGITDLESLDSGISIMDLGLNEFHLDLQALHEKYNNAESLPNGIHAITTAPTKEEQGVIFILKNINSEINIKQQNRLHPFYLLFINEQGKVIINQLQTKDLLNLFKLTSAEKDQPIASLVKFFNEQTSNGKDMSFYTELLTKSIQSIIEVQDDADLDSIFSDGPTTLGLTQIQGLDDFELISFLVLK